MHTKILSNSIHRGLLQKSLGSQRIMTIVLRHVAKDRRARKPHLSDEAPLTNQDLLTLYNTARGNFRQFTYGGIGAKAVQGIDRYLLQLRLIDMPHDYFNLPLVSNPVGKLFAHERARIVGVDSIEALVYTVGVHRPAQWDKDAPYLVFGREYNPASGRVVAPEMESIAAIAEYVSLAWLIKPRISR